MDSMGGGEGPGGWAINKNWKGIREGKIENRCNLVMGKYKGLEDGSHVAYPIERFWEI